jgi:hypothetical protein
MSEFGDFSDEIATDLETGTYKLLFQEVVEKTNSDGRPYRLLNFLMIDDSDAAEDFAGESASVFMWRWTNLTREEYDNFDAKLKKEYRSTLKMYENVATALGAEEDEVKSKSVDWNSLVGTEVYANLYTDKQGQIRMNVNTLKLASAVDLENRSDFDE